MRIYLFKKKVRFSFLFQKRVGEVPKRIPNNFCPLFIHSTSFPFYKLANNSFTLPGTKINENLKIKFVLKLENRQKHRLYFKQPRRLLFGQNLGIEPSKKNFPIHCPRIHSFINCSCYSRKRKSRVG